MGDKIGIIGAGALGCYVGAFITQAGEDVTFIDMWPEHVEKMRNDGLHVTGSQGPFTVPVKAMHLTDAQKISEPFDFVFISVKSYDTEWATTMMLNYIDPDSGVFIDFQNGINDERVAAVVGIERAMACIITIGAGMYEPGHVVRSDANDIGFKIGEHDGSDHGDEQ